MVAGVWSMHHADYTAEENLRKWSSWPSTRGTPYDTRVTELPLSAAVARVRVIRQFDGECLVRYSVGGKDYSVWGPADSDTDEYALKRRMRTCPVSSFEVHYDPNQPSVAHAFSRPLPRF